MFGDVSHNIFDRINPVGFAKVARGVVALVDNGAELARPFSSRLKRPDWRFPNSYKTLTVVYAVHKKE
jgi:hypothetical protein